VGGAADVDRDGWVDFLSVGIPGGEARWFRNPAGATGHWQRHVIAPEVSNESPTFVDVDGDGRIDLLMGKESARRVLWLETGSGPDRAVDRAPDQRAGSARVPAVPPRPRTGRRRRRRARGRARARGWYAAPVDRRTSPWPFQPENWQGSSPFGPQGAAQMHTQDVDGDGDLDVFTSSPHAYGVWWWERNGPTSYAEHLISNEFSQSHSLVLADVDGDGTRDVITGKRWYAHGPSGDPGSQEAAVLVWFQADARSGRREVREAAHPPRFRRGHAVRGDRHGRRRTDGRRHEQQEGRVRPPPALRAPADLPRSTGFRPSRGSSRIALAATESPALR
jgi:hypothetical protein